jgi:hypothetical protein
MQRHDEKDDKWYIEGNLMFNFEWFWKVNNGAVLLNLEEF